MCGIVGYIGNKQAADIIIEGLEKLEYRGYDSAGVAVISQDTLKVTKKQGRLKVLADFLEEEPIEGTIGIGHTRWATHGAPSDENSHPHTSMSGDIAVVHNGIIENYMQLRQWLIEEGYTFTSETDTEVIAHLIDHHYKGGLMAAVQKTLRQLEGSYALAITSIKHPDILIAARKDSPLIVGIGEGENFIASDIPAILNRTRKVYLIEDKEIAILEKDTISIFDEYGVTVQKDVFEVDWDVESAEKGGYKHFMIKEILEEPKALRDTLSPRLKDGKVDLDIDIDEELIKNVRRIIIVACGTAYHAGIVGKYAIEKTLGIPVEVDIASEYRYRDPVVSSRDIFIVISQSGETADTLAALRMAKRKGAKIIAITNVVGSSVSREADSVMYTWAGPEIAVASTKAHTTQLLSVYLLMIKMGVVRGDIDDALQKQMVDALGKIPEQAQEIIENEETIKMMAHRHYSIHDAYFLGRNLDFAVAQEGSLKLKEISYIHSEAFAAGELKHGPIALIEEGTLVIVIASQSSLYEKTASNIKEVKARGAHVMAICSESADMVMTLADEHIAVPVTMDIFMPILTVIPTQLLAYYCSVERGIDVDKPRNLAKSVTVE
ncbi:MAG: glutamine--fructose-6-phosphate transaminase (isomerizing) [Clostridiales bacterium]|nr:glutamine--fructose-6-phosphate transaminase (isomerizing) [Clostridiales bacterium]